MMTTDKDYRFNEMDGFQPVNMIKGSRVSPNQIWMTVFRSHVAFTKEAQKTLFKREYIRFAYNAEKKQLLIMSTPDAGKDTVFVLKSAPCNGMSCVGLRVLLEEKLRYDLSVVRVRIPGTVCRSNSNGIIFDLSKAITIKPVQIKREKK